jgi:hypothetical protein
MVAHSYPQLNLAFNLLLKPFEQLPLTHSWGMILAARPFFDTKGQKQNSFHQARELIRNLRKELGIVILLAAFNKNLQGQIDLLTDDSKPPEVITLAGARTEKICTYKGPLS